MRISDRSSDVCSSDLDGEREATGALYRLDPNLDWQRMDRGYVVTNGPAFSPNYRTLYHSDTAKGTIYAFDLSPDGKIANKRVFATIPEGDGYPDGMTCDRSEEHTSELQSLMRISYAVFCLKKKNKRQMDIQHITKK